jgi:hypothetical protein
MACLNIASSAKVALSSDVSVDTEEYLEETDASLSADYAGASYGAPEPAECRGSRRSPRETSPYAA